MDYDTADATRPAGMVRLSTPDTEELTAELDGATEWLGVAADEILARGAGPHDRADAR